MPLQQAIKVLSLVPQRLGEMLGHSLAAGTRRQSEVLLMFLGAQPTSYLPSLLGKHATDDHVSMLLTY